MRIVLLAHELPGGPDAEHIARLSERHELIVGLTGSRPAGEARIGGARVVPADEAVAGQSDIAIALDWQATVRLFEAETDRFAFRVEELAFEALGELEGDRLVATLAYDLPVDFIAASPSLARALEQHRPGVRIALARRGVQPLARTRHGDDALAVHPIGDDAHAAVSRMREPHQVARSLAEADVAVLLEPTADVLDLLDAAAAGVVPVVLPVGGHEDLVAHMESGVVATHEDPLGVARDLDRIAADRELRARLAEGARARAAQWPSLQAAVDELDSAVRALVAEPPPAQTRWPARLMADAVAISTVRHLQERRLQRELGDVRVAGSPVRRVVRGVKGSRRLTPARKALSRYVPDRIKRLG